MSSNRPLVRSAEEWIQLLFDPASFDEQFTDVRTPDPLHFADSRAYRERIAAARDKTGLREAVWTGVAWLGGQRVVAAVSDFRFIGGTMGFAVGERVADAMHEARKAKIPFVALTCSGGVRMQEGVVALFQMAKTVAAAQRLHEAGVPMISVLANPTTGGVYASYGTQADLIVAEEGAVIGFAGARVRAVTDAPDGESLHAADLWEAGQVDVVLPADQIRPFLIRAVRLLGSGEAPALDSLPPPLPVGPGKPGWDTLQVARRSERPHAARYVELMLSDFIPIRGDRAGTDDPAVIAGFGRLGETNIVCVGQDRTHRDGRVTPAGYRKAQRAMLIADRLRLPLITLVDTPGASDSLADERAGLAGAISDCLATMAAATTPTVAVVIGEGGSGGALAFSVADRLLMQENAVYAVTSPEGAAAILYRDRERAPELANHLGMTAAELLKLRVIDTIVPEPNGGAHLDPSTAATMLALELQRALATSMRGRGSARRRQREKRLHRLGRRRFAPLRDAADMLAGVSEMAVHAFDSGRQLLEDRLRGRDRSSTSDEEA